MVVPAQGVELELARVVEPEPEVATLGLGVELALVVIKLVNFFNKLPDSCCGVLVEQRPIDASIILNSLLFALLLLFFPLPFPNLLVVLLCAKTTYYI